MTNQLNLLLKKILLGSLAGIASNNATGSIKNMEWFSNEEQNKFESFFKKKTDLTPKLILKKNSHNEWFEMAHRSHRSHSSHRSHYSSSSGTTYTQPSSSSKTSGTSSSTSSNSTSSKSGTENIAPALELGSRTLKKGMKGTDVTELVNILLRRNYLKLDDGGTFVTGTYEYDTIIEDAIKKFQTDNGLANDGICGATTIYYLKN